MPSAKQNAASDANEVLLAGLQAGVLAVLAMLAWVGLASKLGNRSFWTAANLMASTFYGDDAIHSGFARITLSGLALYVVIYGSLGALFAVAVNGRAGRLRVVLLGLLLGVAWYYLSFGLLWKRFSPLIPLLHAEHPTLLGHLIYGGLLSRYQTFLPHAETEPAPPAETAPISGNSESQQDSVHPEV